MSEISAKESTRTFFGVQALRAIAALLVVEHHATGSWAERIMRDPHITVWMNGSAGVDIFFVISGFVMAISAPGLADYPHKGWVFLRRRFIRIIPLYWIITTVKLLRLEYGPSIGGQTAGSTWHIIASYLFIPSLNYTNAPEPLLAVGWTLNFEMMFYLLFAVALALDLRPVIFLVPVLIAVAVAGCFNDPSWPACLATISPLVLEFLFGMLLAHFTLRGQRLGKFAGILLLIAGGVLISTLPSTNLPRAIYWGLPAVAIVAGTVALEGAYGRRLPKWLLEAGNASYAIYLIHLFVVAATWAVLLRLHVAGDRAWVAMVVLSLIGSLIAGEIIHRFIEVPLMNLFRKKPVAGVSVLPA